MVTIIMTLVAYDKHCVILLTMHSKLVSARSKIMYFYILSLWEL